MIQLVTCDIDGTLLQNGAMTLQPELFDQIRALKEKGILFCPASGRQYTSLRWLFEPVADDLVYMCENGGVLYKDGRVISTRPLPRPWAEQLTRDILAVPGGEVLISGADMSYVIPKDPAWIDRLRARTHNNIRAVRDVSQVEEDILKVSVWYAPGAEKTEALLAPAWRDKVKVAISGAAWLDFTLADKGTGLEDLCRVLNIDPACVLSFGDNINDVALLEKVGRPYLMRSTHPDLRARFPLQCSRPEEVLRRLLDEGESAV